jgi:hypothetical protein
MLWVYYSAQILLFGGALGAVVDEQKERPASRPSLSSGVVIPLSQTPKADTSKPKTVLHVPHRMLTIIHGDRTALGNSRDS